MRFLILSIFFLLSAPTEAKRRKKHALRTNSAYTFGKIGTYSSEEKNSSGESYLRHKRKGFQIGLELERGFTSFLSFFWDIGFSNAVLENKYEAFSSFPSVSSELFTLDQHIGARIFLLQNSTFDIWGGAGVRAGYSNLSHSDVSGPSPVNIDSDSFFNTGVFYEGGLQFLFGNLGLRFFARRTDFRTSSVDFFNNRKINVKQHAFGVRLSFEH